MLNNTLSNITFRYRPHKGQAHARVVPSEVFLVLADSTAMKNRSAVPKRGRGERGRLGSSGVLIPHRDPELYLFTRNQEFSSPGRAPGLAKGDNASAPRRWLDISSAKSVKDMRGSSC